MIFNIPTAFRNAVEILFQWGIGELDCYLWLHFRYGYPFYALVKNKVWWFRKKSNSSSVWCLMFSLLSLN